MDVKLLFAIVSGLLFVLGNSIYAVETVQRKATPQRTTWLIYIVLESINFANQLASDAGYGALPYIFAVAAMFVIFILSLKFGTGGYQRLDLWVGGIAGIGIIGWIASDRAETDFFGVPGATVSVIFSGIAIIVASTPTIYKIFKDPFSESYSVWAIALVGLVFNVIALEEFSFATLFIPIIWIINNSLIVVLQYVLRPRKNQVLRL